MLGLGEREGGGKGVKPNLNIVRIVNTIDIYGPSLTRTLTYFKLNFPQSQILKLKRIFHIMCVCVCVYNVCVCVIK